MWYALKITRDSGSLNSSGGSVLSDRESFFRVRGENAKFKREMGEFRFMKAKIRWKTFIGFWVLARISCNFPPLWLFGYLHRSLKISAKELLRKEGGVNMINIVTREGTSSQNVSSLEIIVHYMHEHELLKGRKNDRKKNFFPRRLHLLAFPRFFFSFAFRFRLLPLRSGQWEKVWDGRETPENFFFPLKTSCFEKIFKVFARD